MAIIYFVSRLLLALMAAASVLPLLPVGSWMVRLCDFPRLQMMGLVIVALGGLLAGRSAVQGNGHIAAWCLAGVVVLVWQASHVVPYTGLWPKSIPASNDTRETPLKLIVANLQFENKEKRTALDQLTERDADLLLLIEFDQAWQAGLQPLEAEYPYREGVVREEGLGLMLWSKYPLSRVEVRHLVSDDRASIFADVEYGDAKRGEARVAHFVGLHPTPPGLEEDNGGGRHDSRIRDAELMLVAKHIAEHPTDDWIVTGDFNDVAWSHTTRLFQRLSGLKDPRVGRGLFNTYHAKYWGVRFPIDHVFLPASARIVRLDRFQPGDSDHFAFMAEFTLQGNENTVPEPEGNDQQEAEEMIDEGEQDAQENGDGAA